MATIPVAYFFGEDTGCVWAAIAGVYSIIWTCTALEIDQQERNKKNRNY